MESFSRQKIKLFVALCFFLSSCKISESNEGLENALNDIKATYAPDGRTSVFEYEIVNDSLIGKTDNAAASQSVEGLLKQDAFSKLVNSLEKLPSQSLGADTIAYINVSVGNIRAKSAESSELSTQALLGTPLRVLEKSGYWYRVQTPDAYIGFIESSAISFENFFESNNEKVLYIEPFGFSYTLEDSKTKVSDVTFGNIFKRLEKRNQYSKVQYPDGRIAFLPNSALSAVEEFVNNTKPEEAPEASKELMGVPYLWGGTSWKGVDCSGFTRTSFLMNGVYLPRDASQQALTGDAIDTKTGFENLIKGDLLFFGRQSEKGPKVTHVAIYLGNLDFIHSSGMVKYGSFNPESKFYDDFNLNRFLFAKRIIGSNNTRYLNPQTFY